MSLSPEPIVDDAFDAEMPRYRAVNQLAVGSMVLGALSFLTALGWQAAVIPLAGIATGWLAHRRILRAPEEWTGLRLAQWGIGLSVAFWAMGSGRLLWEAGREVPSGYTLVGYDKLQPDPSRPTEPIPESATLMNDKKVYIRGFMQARRQQNNIKEFVLCVSTADCPFCVPEPKPTEMIRVILQGDMVTEFTTRQIGVAGRLHVDSTSLTMPYSLDADILRR
jgi:hypothetical protein